MSIISVCSRKNGFRESRRCPRSTHPDSYITECTRVYEDNKKSGMNNHVCVYWEEVVRLLTSGVHQGSAIQDATKPNLRPVLTCVLRVHLILVRKVDVRLPGKGNSNSHGARTVHLSITMIKWIRTIRLSIKNSLSRYPPRIYCISQGASLNNYSSNARIFASNEACESDESVELNALVDGDLKK
jgi:hypothetical protein